MITTRRIIWLVGILATVLVVLGAIVIAQAIMVAAKFPFLFWVDSIIRGFTHFTSKVGAAIQVSSVERLYSAPDGPKNLDPSDHYAWHYWWRIMVFWSVLLTAVTVILWVVNDWLFSGHVSNHHSELVSEEYMAERSLMNAGWIPPRGGRHYAAAMSGAAAAAPAVAGTANPPAQTVAGTPERHDQPRAVAGHSGPPWFAQVILQANWPGIGAGVALVVTFLMLVIPHITTWRDQRADAAEAKSRAVRCLGKEFMPENWGEAQGCAGAYYQMLHYDGYSRTAHDIAINLAAACTRYANSDNSDQRKTAEIIWQTGIYCPTISDAALLDKIVKLPRPEIPWWKREPWPFAIDLVASLASVLLILDGFRKQFVEPRTWRSAVYWWPQKWTHLWFWLGVFGLATIITAIVPW